MKSAKTESRLTQLKEQWEALKGQSLSEDQKQLLVQNYGFLLHKATKLSLNSYQTQAGTTAMYPHDHAFDYLGLKLASEAGEVAGKLGKRYRDSDGLVTHELCQDLKAELGDVLWYVAMLASELGYSLEEVAQANLNKLADRKARGKITGSGDNR